MATNSLQPSQEEVGSSAPHLLNLGWPCGLALTKRLQQEWCCATSKLTPQGACSFYTCPLKTSLPCKQARASLLEITGPQPAPAARQVRGAILDSRWITRWLWLNKWSQMRPAEETTPLSPAQPADWKESWAKEMAVVLSHCLEVFYDAEVDNW